MTIFWIIINCFFLYRGLSALCQHYIGATGRLDNYFVDVDPNGLFRFILDGPIVWAVVIIRTINKFLAKVENI